MTQHETQGQEAAYLCLTQDGPVQKRVLEPVQPQRNRIHAPGPAVETGWPDTRSPLDPWHSEQYLIKCLIRTHGWRVVEPGLIRKARRAAR